MRGRTQALAACRASLPAGVEVIVIEDDGPVALGPAAARNTGTERVATPFIAFVDSDVVLGADALQLLSGTSGRIRCSPLSPRASARSATVRAGSIATCTSARRSTWGRCRPV